MIIFLDLAGETMKEKIIKLRDTAGSFWTSRTKGQKILYIVSSLIIISLIIFIILFSTKKNFVPLYNNLSIQEIGQIKGELDTRGIQYELENGGTTILVPKENADALLVDLAGQGIPKSGSIDYSFFSENASWGITDNEFSIMKLDATQTELANLIKKIDGINDASVMINMPKDPVFVSEKDEQASASIVLNTKPGYEFKGNQIESLYHLVSKSVPNLSAENIVIMNQYFEYYDQDSKASGNQQEYTFQQTVKKDIEKDIQRRLQQMLGAMVGMDKVIVSVTADVDFTQENRVEDLVDPVDVENMEGLPVSIEKVHETYTGNPAVGGIAGTGDEDVPGYQAVAGDGNGEYELIKETINNEFNRIHKEIAESPFKVRDLGVQVAVDNALPRVEGEEVQLLSQQEQNAVEDGITSILNSMITTSIDKEFGEIDPADKVSIVFQQFNGNTDLENQGGPAIPLWMYIVGGILLVAVIVLVIMLVRKRRRAAEDEEELEILEEIMITEERDVEGISEDDDSESVIRRKQLEKMAQEKPEDFAKLLRSWIAED